jgi:hypothetical protein
MFLYKNKSENKWRKYQGLEIDSEVVIASPSFYLMHDNYTK